MKQVITEANALKTYRTTFIDVRLIVATIECPVDGS